MDAVVWTETAERQAWWNSVLGIETTTLDVVPDRAKRLPRPPLTMDVSAA